MKYRYLLFLLVICSTAFAQRKLVHRIDSLIASANAFSGVVLIADMGKPVYHKAFGYADFAKRTPLKKDYIFELASISKTFTAAIILMLREAGLLNLDDPAEKYLTIPYKGISIRHLLTHTSGLPDYQEIMDQHWDKSRVAGNPDILEYLNRYSPPVLFEPGSRYEYSNTGYVLLASIAEKASGRDFVELCREKIFRPLRMNVTDIRSPEAKAATNGFTAGHYFVEEKGRYIRADSFPSSDYTIWLGNRKGPGRVSSTAEDLLKWDQALYSRQVLNEKTLAEAYAPMRLNDGTYSNYGFGWMITDHKTLGKIVKHTGDNPGYRTQLVRCIDKNKTIIILSNNASDVTSLVNGILQVIEE